MKKAIQRLANRFGYRISRLSSSTSAEDAFTAMQRLLIGIKELSSLVKSYRVKSHKVVPVKSPHNIISRQDSGVKGSAS
jgi:hypothetical protein